MTIQQKFQTEFINTEFKGVEDMKEVVEKLLKEKVLT